MKLSISNLAWEKEFDTEMYQFLSENKYDGVEIAPSKIFGENPYTKIEGACKYKEKLKSGYGLEISSMQSIWYGRTENIFISNKEREILFEYTKKAIEFANALECSNLVFGCPRNRNIPAEIDYKSAYKIAVEFLYKLAEYSHNNNITLSIEANPKIYNTNFINKTIEAIELCKAINLKGIALNLDTGTMIENNEKMSDIVDGVCYVKHVHISEPFLKPISFNELQCKLMNFLNNAEYDKYVSIEMNNGSNIEKVKTILINLKKITEEKYEKN